MLRIGIVAGEASGDWLAAELVRQLRARCPDMIVEGIGGEQLRAVGCRLLAPMERLSVIGLLEVIGSYHALRRLRNTIAQHFLNNPPAVFIGVDAPDFNIGLEYRLRRRGIKTVHYVSPSVWAWRGGRIHAIKKAVDLMLTLFPFEQEYYQQAGVPSQYAGHPLARSIALQPDKPSARAALGLDPALPAVALLPGSRANELARLSRPFIEAALLLQQRHGKIQFISSALNRERRTAFSQHIGKLAGNALPVQLHERKLAAVLQAADAALVASGTATLEAMLHKCPMVVAYRVNPISYYIIKAMSSAEHIALPNILGSTLGNTLDDTGGDDILGNTPGGGRPLVDECVQADCRAERLAAALARLLWQADARRTMRAAFTALHRALLTGRDDIAANAVLHLIGRPC